MNYSRILKSNYKLILAVILVIAILVLGVTAFQTFKYQASTKLLVIQKQTASLDAYTATKSAERISKSLSEIIYTSSFYDNVIDSNLNLKHLFPEDDIERRKAWEKNVDAKVYPESGILEISVYHQDPEYAAQLVRSVAYALINKGGDYHGGGSDVNMKIVDNVMISRYPVRPNIFLNLALAILGGFVLSSGYVFMKTAKKLQQQEIEFDQKPIKEVETKDEKQVQITTVYDHLESVA